MDVQVLVQALTSTLDPQGRAQAESQLEQVRFAREHPEARDEILNFIPRSIDCPNSRHACSR